MMKKSMTPSLNHENLINLRAVAITVDLVVYCAVREQGQESQLMDQEQRSDNGTEDATIGSTLGSRTGGELLEVPDAGFPARYLWHDVA